MMPTREIAIYGAGGFAREVAWLVESCNGLAQEEKYKIVCFVDDELSAHDTLLNGYPIIGLEKAKIRFPRASIVGGVGAPKTRMAMMNKARAIGFSFETIIHPRVERSNRIKIGIGTIVCAGNILTVDISLGEHVQINLDCTIGHDVVLGDYTTLAPGVHVSGWVSLGKRVYIGTGAVILNGTKESPLIIGDDAVIGGGACVTKSVAEGVTVVGIPAKPLVRGS
jgi:sugar O-acyltransferase (sialic acid O-acetyltransferase NeuD family)